MRSRLPSMRRLTGFAFSRSGSERKRVQRFRSILIIKGICAIVTDKLSVPSWTKTDFGRLLNKPAVFTFIWKMDPISRLISDGLLKLGEGNIDERSVRIPIERYRWPLAFGLLLLLLSAALSDRRKEIRRESPTC